MGSLDAYKSGWVFMTEDVLPGSRGKPYAIQEGLVANLDRQTPYEVPTTLKAVVCISTKYLKSGKRLFNDKQWTYTRCQEQVQGYHILIGGFGTAGLSVDFINLYNIACDGVGALRSSVLGT